MKNIYASCIKWKNNGILLIGDSGSGKSDICLRFIINHSALLVADDRVDLSVAEDKVIASCPEKISGLLEVRGVGIKKVPFAEQAQIKLVVELAKTEEKIERLPETEIWEFEGKKVPLIRLWSGDISVIEKIIAALSFENTY